jgi:hypothetical protein
MYVVIKVVTTLKWNVIYVYNYASSTIFKHRRICKICTANICSHYMWLLKYMQSFLIEKFELDFIEKNSNYLLLLTWNVNSVISLQIMLFGTYNIDKPSFEYYIYDSKP